jgi:hypothetical protein
MSNERHVCSACGEAFVGPIGGSIHRDGFGIGPEVVLCDPCGGHEFPSCEELWSRIAARLRAGAVFEVTS